MSMTESKPMRDRRGRVYTPAIGNGLRPLLWVLLVGFALLAANGVYLASVKLLGWLGWLGRDAVQTNFSLWMLLAHLALGILLIVPFVIFGLVHLVTSWKRPNRAAVRFGVMLLICASVLLGTGFFLWSGFVEIRDPRIRAVFYWVHVLTPVGVMVLYLRHRLAGPRVNWHWARVWVASVAGFVAVMAVFHTHDPRQVRRSDDPRYTFPSEAKLAEGKLISADVLMMDEYCLNCHKDTYEGWFHSAHHFSSFNNPAYLFSVRETRKVSMERDGNTRASRWCAGCHDPVPFFSGAFDDPNYDDVNTRSSQAGITCTVCHAITKVNSTRGNADYTIEEPRHYPFAMSKSPVLQWINQTLVKAKPEMHRRTFLKPEVHRNSEFCSTCHKVSIPYALNHYKDFLRGQNHWDNFILSGVSGGGARSFYYPPVAKTSCNDCHMTLVSSSDFGARDFDGKGGLEVHSHQFMGSNTGLPVMLGDEEQAEAQARFLADKQVRIDLFGLREGGEIDGPLVAPLRPEAPSLSPGKSYLVETVVRTLALGHFFSQGTVDSNEIWVELVAKSGGRVIGRSGGIAPDGEVDPYSHFINVYMLDRHGKRIDRRNPQDIFVPLYNKQIPPGAGQVVHFRLDVPKGLEGPIELEARLNYRKFDKKYLDYVYKEEPEKRPKVPVVVMATDAVALAVEGGPSVEYPPSPIKETWQRWNDYGIGLLLEGGAKGAQKGELRQAEEAFGHVAREFKKGDGWSNLARVYLKEGRNADALSALEEATRSKEPAPPWVVNWLSAQVDERNGSMDAAIAKYRDVLNTRIPERKFDFSRDYEVLNALGRSLWGRYHQEPPESPDRPRLLEEAIDAYRRTLGVDSENVDAHYGLGLAYSELVRVLSGGKVDPKPTSKPVTTPEGLAELAALVSSPSRSVRDRVSAADRLVRSVPAFVNSPRPEFGSRLQPLLDLDETLAGPCEQVNDAALRASLARVLGVTHSTLHSLYRPDETARGIAQKAARADNHAADKNANSVVIHSLHRPGAPGIDRPSPVAQIGPETEETAR
jgi:tetratricopeptide (TPR) repeat protein